KVDTDKTDEMTTETTTGESNQETEPASETTTKAKEETGGSNAAEGTTESTTTVDEKAAEPFEKPAEITKYEYKSDEVNVSVTLTNPEDLPDDAELVVTPVTLSQKVENKISKQS